MVSGCARFNPAYEETASASGGQSGTSAAGSSGSATLGSGTTGDAESGTTDDGTTNAPSGPTMSSGGVDTGSSGVVEDGTDTGIKYDLGELDPPTVVLYPSVLVGGDFAADGGPVDSIGLEECAAALDGEGSPWIATKSF